MTFLERAEPGFDRECRCEYTGRQLWKWPDVDSGLMIYYREPDGYVRRARPLTAAELFWIRDNPGKFLRQDRQFRDWLEKSRKK